MRSRKHRGSVGWVWLVVVAGCAPNDPAVPNRLVDGPSAGAPATGGEERDVSEADIFRLDGGRLYALSRKGILAVIDVSMPGRLTSVGRTQLPVEPFDLHPRGDSLIALSSDAESTQVIVLAAENGTPPAVVATAKVPGRIADSRIVGDVLYLVTFEPAACPDCPPAPRTIVTSFDLGQPRSARQVDQVSFQSDAPTGRSFLSQDWKRSLLVGEGRLYVAGLLQLPPLSPSADEGIIEVLDITDDRGRLGGGAHLVVAGAILSRWQLDERGGVLRVISQRGAGRTLNGVSPPELQTFRIDSTQSFVTLARLPIRLPDGEGLRAVRFVESRAYAVTHRGSDPLFVFDLSDPTRPLQRGELTMPGFLFHLEPRGDRLIGLGVDGSDPGGGLNVSLVDVADAGAPRLIQRVSFGPTGKGDIEVANSGLVEDQDRLGKAFQIFPDGSIAVPFRGLRSGGDACRNAGGGVQLVDWSQDRLTRGALLPLPGRPRRAFQNGPEIITISDSYVRSFPRSMRDPAVPSAEVTIEACDFVVPSASDLTASDLERAVAACATAPGRAGRTPLPMLVMLVVAARALQWWRTRRLSRGR
jgi:hypothetical protein